MGRRGFRRTNHPPLEIRRFTLRPRGSARTRSVCPFINGVKSARQQIVARTDEDRTNFLQKRGFSKADSAKIIDAVLVEEGRRPESLFDFVQGITAVARRKPHQDDRLTLEGKAKRLFDLAT